MGIIMDYIKDGIVEKYQWLRVSFVGYEVNAAVLSNVGKIVYQRKLFTYLKYFINTSSIYIIK